ncbi:MAG: N-formylglutamate amidohydrolase [Sphingomonadaceae bacterium]|nr:N-formylglutamate amidohydrolase [Sphingomonadaceae bacterium]
MEPPFRLIDGDSASGLLLVADHASDHVPDDIDLGIDATLLGKHIAVDIGVDRLSDAVAESLGCPAIVATLSRLVVDLHREPDNAGVIPVESDGHIVPGNVALDEAGRAERIARFWNPYHVRIAALIDLYRPQMLFTLHSFTPALETAPEYQRPWQCGILYNEDDRAPRIAIPKLEASGLTVGENEPYSGKQLNATMNQHAERPGLPYLAIEVRNHLIADDEGVQRWADILAPVIAETRDTLAEGQE